MFEFTRTLHPDDYPLLAPYASRLREFKGYLNTLHVGYREDHEHRLWEYAIACKALAELGGQGRPVQTVRVLDTGSGCSYLPLFLKMEGYDVTVNDSCAYGDVTEWFHQQEQGLGLSMPLNTDPVEALHLPDGVFDFTMCISVLEHVDAAAFGHALSELGRVTRPGGYIYLTSDLFPDKARWEVSPFKQIQHNVFTPENAIRAVSRILPADPVGVMEPFTYRGDFVHNYSFLSMLWRKWNRTPA
jgi:SAM-dependent methyltransferase